MGKFVRKFKIVINILTIFGMLISPFGPFDFVDPQHAKATAYSGVGNGQVGSAFRITTCAQLQEISNSPALNYILGGNIDCTDTVNWNSGAGFLPIDYFSGSIDGRNYTINGLTINSSANLYGGSGFINHLQNGGVVKNLKVTNGSITFTHGNTSETGFIGSITGGGTLITHVSYAGSVTGSSYTGSLVGSVKNGAVVSKSSSSGDVYGNSYGGGFAAYVYGGTISDCYTTSNVHNINVNAGFISNIIGSTGYTSSIIRSYAAGSVDGHNYTAGFVSQISGGSDAVVLQDIFSVETKAEDMTSLSGIAASVSGTNITLSNILFDQNRANSEYCGLSSGCTAVNVDGLDSQHFMANSAVAPFNASDIQMWSFSSVWQTTESYPTLRDEVVTIYGAGQDGLASGTAYEITTCAQLADANLDLDAYYLLKNNLSCTSAIALIGVTDSAPFTGHFDGGGYTVTLSINNSSASYLGLFSYLNNATVSKVRIAGIISGQQYVGGLAGFSNNGSVSQVVNSATITGSAGAVGGLIGNDAGTSISDCYNTGDVTGVNGIGGIAGDTYWSTIVRSYNRGHVGVASYAGGIVGRAQNSNAATVQDSFDIGGVPGYGGNGAIIGIGWQGENSVSHSYYDVSRSGQTLCGYNVPSGPIEPMAGTNCGQINTAWASPNYFKNNSTNQPFVNANSEEVWDFSGNDSIWQTVENGYPSLRAIIDDETAVDDEPPGVPTDLRVTSKTTGDVSLAWDAPITGIVSSYNIEYTTTGTQNWTGQATRESNNRTISYSGLNSNTSYDFRVSAENTYGTGNWTEALTVVTYSLPDAPSDFTLTQGSTPLSVDISWSAPTNLGGDGSGVITGYELLGGPNGTIGFDSETTSVNDYEISGLTYTTTYTFTLRTVVDYSTYSSETSAIIYTTPAVVIHDISSCAELQNISDFAGSYKLTGPIDCSGISNFAPIGLAVDTEFTGTLDGAGYTIFHLVIDQPENVAGLFFIVGYGGTIKNLGIDNASVTGVGEGAGIVAAENDGVLTNIVASGVATGDNFVGGLAGYNYGRINNSNFGGTINGESYVGGLAGYNVSGESDGTIYNSFSTGQVNASINYTGGLVGMNDGSIYYSYSESRVVANGDYIGGLVGYASGFGGIYNSYARGNVSGFTYVGGLAGRNDSEFDAPIDNCYSTGLVEADSGAGGLAGDNQGYAGANSFWDMTTSGLDYSNGDEIGLVTANMKNETTFTDVGWDFKGIWQIDETNDGYPHLVWQDMQSVDEDNSVSFQGGGTEEFPWMVTNIHGLQFIGRIYVDRSAKLKNDIDASETENWNNGEDGNGFLPIGYSQMGGYYNSTFDGGGHVISDLYINDPNSWGVGLFASIYDSNIKDLVLSGGSVTGSAYTGALVGAVYGTGSITNIQSDINISANGYSGGLIGGIFNSGGEDSTELITINKVMTSGNVARLSLESESYYMGGLIGMIGGEGFGSANISNAYARGNVTGYVGAGGLIGLYANKASSLLSNSYASGNVEAEANVGGLIGFWAAGSINNNFASGQVVITGEDQAGGLIGSAGEISFDSFTNNYFDNLAGLNTLQCIGGLDEVDGCVAINTVASPVSNYSKGVDVALRAPFDTWNFTNTWLANANDYPTFRLTGSGDNDNDSDDIVAVVKHDKIPPVFIHLSSGDPRSINIDQNQIIKSNPYIIKVKASDNKNISKVEFYIDDILICTATKPNENGIYTCSWDTSKYHSIVKAIAYDNAGNKSVVLNRTTTVNLSGLVELPQTGIDLRKLVKINF